MEVAVLILRKLKPPPTDPSSNVVVSLGGALLMSQYTLQTPVSQGVGSKWACFPSDGLPIIKVQRFHPIPEVSSAMRASLGGTILFAQVQKLY